MDITTALVDAFGSSDASDLPGTPDAPEAPDGLETSGDPDAGSEAFSRRSRIGTRKGRRISSAACDLCRTRKLQCSFELDAPGCRRCMRASAPCTFYKQRRPRGPPNKHVAFAKAQSTIVHGTGMQGNGRQSLSSRSGNQALMAAVPAVPMSIPIINQKISLDEFCPPHAFAAVMADFFDEIYPIMPLVHRPTFDRAIRERRYNSDPEFFQLCVAMAAYTITTFPQRMSRYQWGGPDLTVAHIVEFASVIVRLGRGKESRRVMVENPTVAAVVCRLGMSYSCHHSGEFNNGWSHANEAVLMFRELGLYRADAYPSLSRAGAEISRRMFWALYIMQIYSYTSAPEPLTVLHFDTTRTDWDMLRTAEFEYVSLLPDKDDDEALGYASPPRRKHTIIMSGFNAVIGMHVCVSELLVDRLPSPPPFRPGTQTYAMSTSLPSFSSLSTFSSSPSPLSEQYYTTSPRLPNVHPARLPSISLSVGSPTPAAGAAPSSTVAATLNLIEAGMARIRRVLDRLPPELQFSFSTSSTKPTGGSLAALEQLQAAESDPYGSMRVNIHLTGIFMRSLVIETYVAKMLRVRGAPRTWTSGTAAEDSPVASSDTAHFDMFDARLRWNDRFEIWKLREGVAQELKILLQSFPLVNLESTGLSATVKVRRIAATLLDEIEDPMAPPDEVAEADRRRKRYVEYFVRVLAELDHSPFASFGFVRMRS